MTIQDTEPTRTRTRPSKSGKSFWREMPILLGVAFVVAILVRTLVLQTYYVPSGSMEHTLNINDRVLVNKLAYDFHDPRRGDVIVFNAPEAWQDEPGESVFVKRVIGVPGDHVVCCGTNGDLTINGVAVSEPFLDQDQSGSLCPKQAGAYTFDITVPAGRLWVMGDNRCSSADSEYNYMRNNHDITGATIPISSVIGHAFVRFWPFGRAGSLSTPPGFAAVPPPTS